MSTLPPLNPETIFSVPPVPKRAEVDYFPCCWCEARFASTTERFAHELGCKVADADHEVRMADKALHLLVVGMTLPELRAALDGGTLEMYADLAGNTCLRKRLAYEDTAIGRQRIERERHLRFVHAEVRATRIKNSLCIVDHSCLLALEHEGDCIQSIHDLPAGDSRHAGCKCASLSPAPVVPIMVSCSRESPPEFIDRPRTDADYE